MSTLPQGFKARKGFIYAFLHGELVGKRRTDRPYTHALVGQSRVLGTGPIVWSWHQRRDLAAKAYQQAARKGRNPLTIVEVARPE